MPKQPAVSASLILFSLGICLAPLAHGQVPAGKPRIVLMHDPELDDQNTLIRYLLYADQFDTEGIVYTSSSVHWAGDGKGTTWSTPRGEMVRLAGRASEPDGNAVSLTWWQYADAGTCQGTVAPRALEPFTTAFEVPPDAAPGQTIHFVLEATDNGTPALTRYQRVIVTVTPRQGFNARSRDWFGSGRRLDPDGPEIARGP